MSTTYIPRVTYVFKEPKASESLILLIFRPPRWRRLVYSTGHRGRPDAFDPERQRLALRGDDVRAMAINADLDALERAALKAYLDGAGREGVKDALNALTGRGKVRPKGMLPFLSAHTWTPFTKRGKRWRRDVSEATMRARSAVLGQIKAYTPDIDYEGIDERWRDGFVDHLAGQKLTDRTISHYLVVLGSMLTFAANRGQHTNVIHKNALIWPHAFEREEAISLQYAELQKLAAHPLEGVAAKVRDLWLIMAYTSLRHSDAIRISPAHFKHEDGHTYMTLRAKKTGRRQTQRLLAPAKALLARYDYTAPIAYSSIRTLDIIRKVAAKAGLDRRIKVVTHYATGEEVAMKPLHAVIGNHTARRTFASLMDALGISDVDGMAYTGHASVQTYRVYVGGVARQRADRAGDRIDEAFRRLG